MAASVTAENPVKTMMRAGKVALSMKVRLARTGNIARIAKSSGHAFIFIDIQHSLLNLEAICHIVQSVLRSRIQHTLPTLHGLILAIGGSWHSNASQNRLMLSLPHKKRVWFAGLWANASAPPVVHGLQNS
jgi:hypothetical protein